MHYLSRENNKIKNNENDVLHYAKLTNPLPFHIWLPKSGPTFRSQVVNLRHQTPQGQSVVYYYIT